MAKTRRIGIQADSRLEPLIEKVERKGLRLKSSAFPQTLIFLGLAASIYGLALLGFAAVSRFAPEIAITLPPPCRVNPVTGMISGIVALLGGLPLVILGRLAPEETILGDEAILVHYRSGRERRIAWHEIRDDYRTEFLFTLLRLKNGRIVPVLGGLQSQWWQFDLLLSFRVLAGSGLSDAMPSLGAAFRRFKSDLVGPGVTFPIGAPHGRRRIERAITVYGFGAMLALIFSVYFWTERSQPEAGFVPLLIAAFVDWVLARGRYPFDRIVARLSGLTIASPSGAEYELAYADIRSWTPMGEREIMIGHQDRSEITLIAMDGRSGQLLLEAARIASGFGPIRAVSAGSGKAESKRAATA